MPLPNKYSGKCLVCGTTVEPGMGRIERAGSQWVVFCLHCAPKMTPVENKTNKTSQKTLDLD